MVILTFLVFKYNIVTLIYDLSIFHPGNVYHEMYVMTKPCLNV